MENSVWDDNVVESDAACDSAPAALTGGAEDSACPGASIGRRDVDDARASELYREVVCVSSKCPVRGHALVNSGDACDSWSSADSFADCELEVPACLSSDFDLAIVDSTSGLTGEVI